MVFKLKLTWQQNWPEVMSFWLFIFGFILALLARSAVIAYVLISLAGLWGGRVWFRIKKNFKVAWTLTLISFLFGFLIGRLILNFDYGNGRVIVFLYVLGIFIGFYLHETGVVKSVEF